MTRWTTERRELLFEGLAYAAFGIAFAVLTVMVPQVAEFRLGGWMMIGIGFVIAGRTAIFPGSNTESSTGKKNRRAYLPFCLAGAVALLVFGSQVTRETRSMLWLALPLASATAAYLFYGPE